jgi:hypothetical protein
MNLEMMTLRLSLSQMSYLGQQLLTLMETIKMEQQLTLQMIHLMKFVG